MFVPEYTITPKTLKNIALSEYSKAIIDSTIILPNWERQLFQQTLIDSIHANLSLEGLSIAQDNIKKILDNLDTQTNTNLVKLMWEAIILTQQIPSELNENDLKKINTLLTGQETFRSKHITNKVMPEEILAEMVELYDWINSLDAQDTHPVVVAAIAMARLHAIYPFDKFEMATNNIAVEKILFAFNYSIKNYLSLEAFFVREKKDLFANLESITALSNDFTSWIEYFSEAFSIQIATVQEKVQLLAKDTKLAKATGRIKLSERQEKIVEHIQDYGILQNKDFSRLFPEKSEDSILRDLKALVDKGIIKKTGSTKSSRYELN